MIKFDIKFELTNRDDAIDIPDIFSIPALKGDFSDRNLHIFYCKQNKYLHGPFLLTRHRNSAPKVLLSLLDRFSRVRFNEQECFFEIIEQIFSEIEFPILPTNVLFVYSIHTHYFTGRTR